MRRRWNANSDHRQDNGLGQLGRRLLKGDERVAGILAGTVDETIHEARFGGGQPRKSQHLQRHRGNSNPAMAGKEGQRLKGVRLGQPVETLQGKIGLRQYQVAHVDGPTGSELTAEKFHGTPVLVRGLAHKQADDNGRIEAGAAVHHGRFPKLPTGAVPAASAAQPAATE